MEVCSAGGAGPWPHCSSRCCFFKAQVLLNLESDCSGRLEKGREMSLPSWCPHKPLPALEQLVLAQSQAWICACLHGMCVRTKQVSPKAKPTPNPGAAQRWELGLGTWAGDLGRVLRGACGPVPGAGSVPPPCASPPCHGARMANIPLGRSSSPRRRRLQDSSQGPAAPCRLLEQPARI